MGCVISQCFFIFILQSCAMWINPILQDMLRYIFQSCILESNEEILELIQKVCCLTLTSSQGKLTKMAYVLNIGNKRNDTDILTFLSLYMDDLYDMPL